MKVLQTLFLAVCTFAFLTGCNDYGKEYKLDKKHNVYYKGDGVDEALAKKLAEYLKKEMYFQDDITATVQIVKTKDTFNLNFVVDKEKMNSDVEKEFIKFGGYISKNVFNSAPVTMNLTDKHLKPFSKLGYTPPLDYPTPVQ